MNPRKLLYSNENVYRYKGFIDGNSDLDSLLESNEPSIGPNFFARGAGKAVDGLMAKSSRTLFLIFILLLTAGIFAFALSGDQGGIRSIGLVREIALAQARKNEIVKQNEDLRSDIRRLLEDRTEVEKIAREQLGLVRPNETVYRYSSIIK